VSLDLDKSIWKRVAFGDVVRNRNETIRDARTAGIDRVIGLEHMDPGELKVGRWGSTDDGTTFTRRVKPGQTLFGKRRAYQRKVAYADFDAVCSGDIYTFEAEESQLLPEFLPFLVQSNEFFDHALDTSAGSLSPRTNWRDLATFEFDLPPVDEQQRIAGLLWAIERHRRRLELGVLALRRTLGRTTSRRFASTNTSRRLGELAVTRSGPSFAAANVSRTPQKGSTPILGIPNTKPDGTIDLSDVGFVSGLGPTTETVDPSSLILIRTNGNRDRIGNIYLPPPEANGYAVSAFQFLMKVNDAADRNYIYWALSQPEMQKRMSEAASGTTGLGNLAVGWLNQLEIPWPLDRAGREAIVDVADKYAATIESVRCEMSTLDALRSSLSGHFFGAGE